MTKEKPAMITIDLEDIDDDKLERFLMVLNITTHIWSKEFTVTAERI